MARINTGSKLISRPQNRGASMVEYAILLGAVGPLAALGTLRALERTGLGVPAYFMVPVACACATLAMAGVLSRLLRERWTARK